MTTITKISDSTKKRAKILLAPLDWGLGHATRCIPIIKELLKLKCDVIIAATGDQEALLKEEFPHLSYVDLPGYGVKYGKNRAFTLLKIILGIPKILIRIKQEKAWLGRFVERERPDAVISDNRYGLYHRSVFSVFVTHQLAIRTPFGKWIDGILQAMQYRLIRRFSVCWVPDWDEDKTAGSEEKRSLAGALSHPEKLPSIPVRYIGPLSRFEKKISAPGAAGSLGGDCDLLILLSGPEPQRTLFEKKILEQLAGYTGKAVLVRGMPGRGGPGMPGEGVPGMPGEGVPGMPGEMPGAPAGLVVYPHLAAGPLNAVICGAALVLSRPGYSSVMDLMKLGKKCIFVPTPGQTEQEYLGGYLADRQWALCVGQAGFSLSGAIRAAGRFAFAVPGGAEDEVAGEGTEGRRQGADGEGEAAGQESQRRCQGVEGEGGEGRGACEGEGLRREVEGLVDQALG